MSDTAMKSHIEDYVSAQISSHERMCGDGQLESVMRKAFEAGWRRGDAQAAIDKANREFCARQRAHCQM